MRSSLYAFALILILLPCPLLAWDDSTDNKSPDEFASNEDIALEAKDVCVKAV